MIVIDNVSDGLGDDMRKAIIELAQPEKGIHVLLLESGGEPLDLKNASYLERESGEDVTIWQASMGQLTCYSRNDAPFFPGTARDIVQKIIDCEQERNYLQQTEKQKLAEQERARELAKQKQAEKESQLNSSGLSALQLPGEPLWPGNTSEEAKAIIGRDADGKPLSISFRSANPPGMFALIGGQSGMGKSNLLHAIIYSLASRYSPKS